jgi:hypothetical protein
MAAGHSAGSGIVVRSKVVGGTVVVVGGGSFGHILALCSVAVVDRHWAELVCHDMQPGKQSPVLGLTVVVGFLGVPDVLERKKSWP